MVAAMEELCWREKRWEEPVIHGLFIRQINVYSWRILSLFEAHWRSDELTATDADVLVTPRDCQKVNVLAPIKLATTRSVGTPPNDRYIGTPTFESGVTA